MIESTYGTTVGMTEGCCLYVGCSTRCTVSYVCNCTKHNNETIICNICCNNLHNIKLIKVKVNVNVNSNTKTARFDMSDASVQRMDVEGKGYLSREEAVVFGSQHQSLKEDNKQIKKQLYGLVILCVFLFIGTIAGTVMAIKNSKDTIVDMKTGVMKVNNGADGEDVVTVKAQRTTFKTIASFEEEEDIMDLDTKETSTVAVTSYCVSGEDVARMWLANEQGTDARLVMLEEIDDDGTNEDDDDDDDTDTDTEISRIQPITSGPALWKKDRIIMGGMVLTPSEECDNNAVRRERRMLFQENNDIEQNENKNDDIQSFDPILIHRALRKHVNFLTGRHLRNTR
jgi:hypothetical protein